MSLQVLRLQSPARWAAVRGILLAGLTVAVPGAAGEETGNEVREYRLTRIEGDVLYRAAGAAGWTAAEEGITFREGDRVRTAPRGKAEIASEDGDLVELDEGAEFAADRIRKNQNSFALLVGQALFKISHQENRKFRIKTPVMAIAIRGTEFAVYDAGDRTWESGVVEGRLAVSSLDESGEPRSEEILIGADEGIRVRRGEKPVRLVGLPPRTALLRPRFSQMRRRVLEVKKRWRRDVLQRRRDLRRKLRRPE